MGDILDILSHLNLSPVVTVLLAVAVFFVKGLIRRIESLENDRITRDEYADIEVKLQGLQEFSIEHGTAIAVIKSKLGID